MKTLISSFMRFLYKSFFLIIFIFINTEVPAQYFLKVTQFTPGNFSIYQIGTYREKYEVISDTLISDSIQYFKVRHTLSHNPGYSHDEFYRLNEEGFYAIYIGSQYPEPNKELRYFKKNAQAGDIWAQPFPSDTIRSIYFEVLDTFQTYVYGNLVTFRTLWVNDSSGIWGYVQTWTEEFGVVFEHSDMYENTLMGCYINGVAYGDTNLFLGIEDDNLNPYDFTLFQNYPNPFNPVTRIDYEIKELSFVNLSIYDMLGSEVATLVNEEKYSGRYSVNFNASHLSSGVYFYKLRVGGNTIIKNMVLLK